MADDIVERVRASISADGSGRTRALTRSSRSPGRIVVIGVAAVVMSTPYVAVEGSPPALCPSAQRSNIRRVSFFPFQSRASPTK